MTDRLRRRHALESPIVVAALAVAGLLAVVNGVFPGPGVEHPLKPIAPALAAEYIGKTVLVDVTQLGADDRPVNAKGWVGRIARLSSEEGIVIEIQGEPPCVLPPDLQYLETAQPGLYEGASGEEIPDPDFLTRWTQKEHGTHEELVCPRWTPTWVSRGYWSTRLYNAWLSLRSWFTAAKG
jgi:hypothetical protein